MDDFNFWISRINDFVWSYLLVGLLLGCAAWFTLRTRFVQFRMLREMVRVLGESAAVPGGAASDAAGSEGGAPAKRERHVSSFQAFAVSLASRVGTGNLAGVAAAIAVDRKSVV